MNGAGGTPLAGMVALPVADIEGLVEDVLDTRRLAQTGILLTGAVLALVLAIYIRGGGRVELPGT